MKENSRSDSILGSAARHPCHLQLCSFTCQDNSTTSQDPGRELDLCTIRGTLAHVLLAAGLEPTTFRSYVLQATSDTIAELSEDKDAHPAATITK